MGSTANRPGELACLAVEAFERRAECLVEEPDPYRRAAPSRDERCP